MSNNFFNTLSAIGKDKYIHFCICLVLTLVLYAIGSACGIGVYALVPAFFISMLVGILKERYDARHGGVFDHYDIVADFLGCFLAVVISALLLI